MAQPTVHPFYHAWFKWVDIVVLVPTVYTLLTQPEAMLDAFIPASMSTYNPDQGFLFHHHAALYAFVGIILAGVLRVSNEINVWRVVQAAVLVVDVGLLASTYASLKQQDRLDMESMRAADWAGIIFAAFVAAIRVFFLLGVGVQKGAKSKSF
ncbi:hypothetical protein S7711_01631 [Stachybotrys chartarum IBT 7711]|uniref:DUF7704 domain-containing protein n=1 Tax=Stachybotrys chartarum (strain CBS 109288 / IBT 7711) TaxID=1280523 RepID=A0A084BCB1_STACB|nr:hypothetical protein S7711_01631 [Stachybotrys chartarum IBT 7711]